VDEDERKSILVRERVRLESLGADFKREATGLAGEYWIEMFDPKATGSASSASGSPDPGVETGGRHSEVGIQHDVVQLVPIDRSVQIAPDPPSAADIGRDEEPKGSDSTSIVCAPSGAEHQKATWSS
jgi:hypothetical protein